MKRLTPLLLTLLLAWISISGASAQDDSQYLGMNPAICTAPLPFFNDYDDGFVVLRDGTKLTGKINIKDYEKSGEKINLTTKEGKKYKLNTYSIKYFGLNINIPRNMSPLNLYDWKNEKRKENKDFERGFVVLTSGDTLDGKIHIEGRSSDSQRAEGNFFAIETLTFQDKSGKETELTREKIKSFGRIMPWELSPAEMWEWQKSEAFGKRKSKTQKGFVLMNDGTRLEGDMRLVIKNSMKTHTNPSSDPFANQDKPRNKIFSDLVDEIWMIRDGKDLKLELDDVYAFGVAGMTINTLTNKGARQYQREEMNFHPGVVTTRDGKKYEGQLALRPYDQNYYGVYFAQSNDEPIKIIPMNEITSIIQDVGAIEAFGEEAKPKANSNINGYIVQKDGTRMNGTVKLEGDNGWYAQSISFTDEESHTLKFGGTDGTVSHAAIGDDIYMQFEDFFIKADANSRPFVLVQDPFPAKKGMGGFAQGLAMNMAAMAVGEVVGMAVADAQRGGLDLSGVEMDGQNMGGMAAPVVLRDEKGNVSGYIPRTNAQNIIGSSVSGMALKAMQQEMDKKARKEGPKKDDKSFFLYNVDTRENPHTNSTTWEIYLEGCIDFHGLDKASQKKLLEDSKGALAYLNTCMSKKK